MGDLTESVTPSSLTTTPPPSLQSRTLPIREDCWSEEATSTLVDAWGTRYVELNRGNLRQKDWQDVANSVNALHAHSKKTHRTDVQCKNRVDTIKKKYKMEKARVLSSNGDFTSSWPFFERMDALIGASFTASAGGSGGKNKQVSPSLSPSPPIAVPLSIPYRRSMNVNHHHSPVYASPKQQQSSATTAIVALPQKRQRLSEESNLRRNYSAVAAAAAAAVDADATESDTDDEVGKEEDDVGARGGEGEDGDEDVEEEREGMRVLARAIERFGAVYQRVENERLRQMVDLEKQRMKFAKDLEMERMRIFTETQVQIEKIRRGTSGGGGGGSGKRSGGVAPPGAGSNGERGY